MTLHAKYPRKNSFYFDHHSFLHEKVHQFRQSHHGRRKQSLAVGSHNERAPTFVRYHFVRDIMFAKI